MFGPANKIRLMPNESGVTMDQVRNSERALWHMVTHRMKLHRACIPTIKDVFKAGVGFGIVEPFMVTPAGTSILTMRGANQERRNTRIMEAGEPVESLRYRYLTPGQIVVTPDGSNFNGENPVSVAFFFDSYNEHQFSDMYDDSKLDGEKPALLGNPQQIIQDARSTGFTSDTTIETFIKAVGGIAPAKIRPDKDTVPCRVPVLKVYDRYRRRHLWIANGTTIIYDVQGEYQTLRCPLVKATAWLDANRFYPMSTPEAFERIGWTKNIVVNMFLDMFTQQLKRPLVYNQDFFDKVPEFGPDERIRTSAPDARMGAAYLEPPRTDATAFTFYEMINQIGGKLLGQKDYMDKNYTRGGSMAFNELLATTEGMDRLKGMILDMTFLESTIEQVLIYLQLKAGAGAVVMRERDRDRATGKDIITTLSVTEDDLCHAYELSLDLRDKMRKGMAERLAELQIYDRKMQSPYFDKWEVSADHLCSSDEEVMRQLKSREEVTRLEQEAQQQNRQEQAAQATGREAPPQGEPAAPQPQGVVAGGGAEPAIPGI